MTQELAGSRTKALAYTLGAITLVAVATTAALAVLNRANLPNIDGADPTSIVTPIGIGALGVLVASRQPRNPTGWLFLIVAVVGATNGVEDQYVRYALVTHPGSLPGGVGVDVLNSATSSIIYPAGAVALLLLLLPDGRLPSRRWRPLLPLAVIWAVVGFALNLVAPGPLIGSSSSINYTEPQNPIGLSALNGIYTNTQTLVSAV